MNAQHNFLKQIQRRDFLKSASIAAGAYAFGPHLLAADYLTKPNHGKLIAHSTDAMNAEPPLKDLIQSWITPNDLFYIRSHAPVPKIDTKTFRLKVKGLVEKEIELNLEELAAMKQQTAVATMTCAGNRRYEHSRISPIKGVPWQEGAIGNAKWSGALLSEVLKRAGVKSEAKHVWFDGLDEIAKGDGIIPFGASIPLAKAMDDSSTMPGTLLCTHMNGEALPPDHGYPLRTVVPGYIGARSVKWLGTINVSDKPSTNHYIATAYKVVEEGTDLEWAEEGPIYRFPINSVICTPSPNEKLKPGKVQVAGYALPPGEADRTITRVDVSADGGKTWQRAKISSPVNAYCWVLWKLNLDVANGTDEIMVRAIDSKRNVQPRRVDWNMKGYLWNAWHRVPVDI
ncbi:sulfite oxidase [Planctomicrobium sp.]|jgi:sulfite oxidase|nr:sulfite oxidase [Planctomicrobium sp.]